MTILLLWLLVAVVVEVGYQGVSLCPRISATHQHLSVAGSWVSHNVPISLPGNTPLPATPPHPVTRMFCQLEGCSGPRDLFTFILTQNFISKLVRKI